MRMKTKDLKKQLKEALSVSVAGGFEAIRDKIDYRRLFFYRQSLRVARLDIISKLASVAVFVLIIFYCSLVIIKKEASYDRYYINDKDKIDEIESSGVPHDKFTGEKTVAPPFNERIDRFLEDETYDFYEIQHGPAENGYYVVGYIKEEARARLLETGSVEIEGKEIQFDPKSVDGLLYYAFAMNRDDYGSLLWFKIRDGAKIPARAKGHAPIIVYRVWEVTVTSLENNESRKLPFYLVNNFSFADSDKSPYLVPTAENAELDAFYEGRTELVCLSLDEDLDNYRSLNDAMPEYLLNYQNREDFALPVITSDDAPLMLPVPSQFLEELDIFRDEFISGEHDEGEPVYVFYETMISGLYSLRDSKR